MRSSKFGGFTLIEVMIVVAIIGVIAAIAYPSYTEQVNKTRRGDTQGALMGLANAMERYRANNSGAGYVGAQVPAIFPAKSPIDGAQKFYTLKVESATASRYSISATRYGAQAADKCGDFWIDQSGVRTLKNASKSLADCWR